MNIKNMNELIELMQSDEVKGHFNMNLDFWQNTNDPSCGTACCLGGWVTHKFYNRDDMFDCVDALQQFLEISDDDADKMAYPGKVEDTCGIDAYNATPEQAAKMLSIYLETQKDPIECWVDAMKG